MSQAISVDALDIRKFRDGLLYWGESNFRNFPWRLTSDPYKVMIAEILLHRTQANQVEPVYNKFIERYPDIILLSEADIDDLFNILGSLGLNWRIKLIIDLTKELIENYNGKIPEDFEDLISLPGIGQYIASSIRCFAMDKPDAVIDTNTVRVITRVFGIIFRDSIRRNHGFQALAKKLVDPDYPRNYNFALLDLASKVCTPKNPGCDICPLIDICNYPKIIKS